MRTAADLFHSCNALLAAGQAGAAADAFRACLDRAPGNAGANFNLGNALVAAGRAVDAVDAYLACLRARPDFAPAYLNLATALHGLALLDHARAMATEAVARLPGEPEALAMPARSAASATRCARSGGSRRRWRRTTRRWRPIPATRRTASTAAPHC